MELGVKDICWLAGLIEGEGCFYVHTKIYKRQNGTTTYKQPKIIISMTDKDVIERVAKMFGCFVQVQSKTANANKGGKIQYTAFSTGNKAIAWMMTLYSLMGTRRKAKIKEVISMWKVYEKVKLPYAEGQVRS